MFIGVTFTISEIQKKEDGTLITFRAGTVPLDAPLKLGESALEAEGTFQILIRNNARLKDGDVIYGYVRTK